VTREQHPDIGLLLRLLRDHAAAEFPEFQEPQWNWRAFAALCDEHDVESLVYCRLHRLGRVVPEPLMNHLRSRFLEICARNYHLAAQVVELAAAFEKAQIPVLVYKGPAVASALYGDIALREYHDLDLLVREQDVVEAVTLMENRRFEQHNLPPWFHCSPEKQAHLKRVEEIPFRAPDGSYFVDLHWTLGNEYWRPFSPEFESLWYRTETIALPQGNVPGLCSEDLFLALCSHGTKHRWRVLKWLVDIEQLLRKSAGMDWSRVEKMIQRRPGAAECARLAVFLAAELLDAGIPDDVRRILSPSASTLALGSAIRDEFRTWGSSRGDFEPTLFALDASIHKKLRAAEALRYPQKVFWEIFIQVTHKERAVIELPQKLDFLYHVIRPVRLIAKYGRRMARRLA
jgi:hypothetical protein